MVFRKYETELQNPAAMGTRQSGEQSHMAARTAPLGGFLIPSRRNFPPPPAMAGLLCGQVFQHVLGLLFSGGAEVAPDQFAILEKKGLPFGKSEGFGHSKGVDDLCIGIGEQIKRKFVFRLEGFLANLLVGAHTEDFHALFREGLIGVAQAAGLLGATGSVRLGIEVNERVALGGGFLEVYHFSVLVFLFHGRHRRTHGEGFRQRVAGENRGGRGGEDLGDCLHLGEAYTRFRMRNRQMCRTPLKPHRKRREWREIVS